MPVYVDEVKLFPGARPPFHLGSCHLTSDTEEELHALASRIGLLRIWFQPRSSPHYDLTPTLRERALAAGAVFVPARTQARMRRMRKAAREEDQRDKMPD